MTSSNPLRTTSEVAGELGVSPSSVRRYIRDGLLPEPGWVKRGKMHLRGYDEAWVKRAKRILEQA